MSAHDEVIEQASLAGCVDACDRACGSCKASAMLNIDAYLSAMRERGWKMTPRWPLQEMTDAYLEGNPADPEDGYQIMWDAAPSPGAR